MALLVLIPSIVLVGWAIESERLKRVNLGLVEMNPMTAVLFIASAIALYLHRYTPDGHPLRRLAVTLAGFMVFVGAVKLQALFFTDWDGGIDLLLFRSTIGTNRMAPNTAMNFVLCGTALLSLGTKTRRGWRPAQLLAITAGATSLLALLGYAYGAKTLYGVGTFVPMALHAAFCFLLLCSAILAAFPYAGVMRLVLSDTASGAMLRRLFPAAVLIPALLGLFRLVGLYFHWFDPELGVAVLVVMAMAAFGVLAWINAKILERSDSLRREAQYALNQERNLLRSLIDNLPDQIYIKDREGRYIADNAAHARFVGAESPDQVRGKTVADFFPPAVAEKYDADDRSVLLSGQPSMREEEVVDIHGKTVWLASTKIPIQDGGSEATGLVCISRDITRRRGAEQEMIELQNFLFSIIENIPNMVFVKDAEHLRFVRFNQAGESLLGYAREDLIGKNDYDFFPKEEADFFTANDRAVLNEKKLVDIPAEPIMTRRGERILHTKKIPILIGGVPRYLLGISEDITDRVSSEQQLREQNVKLLEMAQAERQANDALKKAQSQMLQTEKLAALGQLVAGVAHEINNPLSFVGNNVAVLQRDLASIRKLLALYQSGEGSLEKVQPELLAEIRELCERMDLSYTVANMDEMMVRSRDGLRRIQEIVKDLRDFARLDESELQEIDLNQGVESTINIVRGRAKDKQVTISLDLQPLPTIACYPAKVNQVVMNLVANAIDACQNGGNVTVRTSTMPDDAGVRIDVTDTGSGIPPAIRERIFDPFFTTKPQGEGTGLGLSISYGIVRDHNGTIEVTSAVGAGSTFTVKLPRRSAEQK